MRTKTFNGVQFLLIILLLGCEKDSVLIQDSFPVRYFFYNNGDSSLQKVVVYCTTFYPKEKQTIWISAGKWRDPYDYDRQYLLKDTDSLVVESNIKVYPKCVSVFDVALHFKDSNGIGHVKLYTKTDTIYSKSDALIRFSWPKDSLSFNRVN